MTPRQRGALDRTLLERIVDLGIVPVLLIVALLLPPASLGQRLFAREGATISAADGGVVPGPAGAQATVPPGALTRNTRIAYTALQSADPGSGGGDRVYAASLGAIKATEVEGTSPEGQAIAQLPDGIIAYEPFYSLRSLGKDAPTTMSVTVPLPNELAAVEKADLYVWDGEAWRWQPAHPTADLLFMETELVTLPAVIAVTQAQPYRPDMAIGVHETPEGEPEVSVESLSVPGLVIGDDLGIAGSATPLKSDCCLALVSNTVDGVVRSDLTDNILIDDAARSAHVRAMVEAITLAGFDGVDLDYRGVDPALRGEFTWLVGELADALHQKSKRLVVRVEAPATDGVHFDTGAYDWRAIGMPVHRLRVPALTDLGAYAPDGEMDRMLMWAVGEVDRRKLELMASAQARVVSEGETSLINYSEAIGLLADRVTTDQATGLLLPGQSVSFGADGSEVQVDFDPDAQVYYFEHQDSAGVKRTVYLETASSVARKMQYVSRYSLGGFEIDGALSPRASADVVTVIESHNEQALQVTAPQFAIVWSVTDPAGEVGQEIVPLADPSWTWTAPNNPGGYIIGIALSDDGGQTVQAPVAEIDITVPTPTPAPTPTPEPTAEPGTGGAFTVRFVSDVTVADNTQMDKGETFTKTWRLQNSGVTAWPADTRLVFESGEAMTTTKEVSVGKVAPGDEVDISVEMKAPDQDAVAKGRWTLKSDRGAFKGGSVYVQVRVGEPPAAAAAASAPVASAGRVGGYFGYGIQAHIDGDLENIFNHINALGFNWVKQQVEWFRYNPAPGQYDWGHLDRIVDTANAHGVNVLFSVVKAPGWARPAGDTDEGPPSDPATYGTFMREMAARYKGRVRAYEIWNEQNLYYEWGGRGGKLNAGRYVQLLAAAYNAIKSVDPGAVVVSGALTPTGLTDWDIAVDDALYLEEMYKAGLARYCDAVGAHPSGYNNPPDAQWNTWNDPSAPSFKGHRSFFFRSTMEQYRNIMVKYGDGHKRIWPTEFGWATVEGLGVGPAAGYGYAADNTEAEQAQFLVRAYEMGRSWGFVGPMFMWNLNFAPVAGPQDEKAAFGIVRNDWSPRPAFTALQNMPK
ncbi:MAG: NBR1-Ig-like domain-containing protein [Anaerolineae bacterium]|jgi:hypothetical protein